MRLPVREGIISKIHRQGNRHGQQRHWRGPSQEPPDGTGQAI